MQFDLPTLESVATLAIYETNHEVKKQAEEQFEVYLFRLPLTSYEHLLQNEESVVVLATAATLNRHFHKLSQLNQLTEYLMTISAILRSWFREDGRFIRKNGRQLEDYCTNTLIFFIGKCLKQIYRSKGNDKCTIEWLMSPQQGDKYRLFLFLSFIQCVSLPEPGIGFVDYKVLLNAFQKEVMPHIFGCLYPYFIHFSYDIQIIGLTMMQQNMSLNNQRQPQQDSPCRTLNKFDLCLFKLLNEIIQFKYDLNFKQFEESSQTLHTISFPEFIINQVIKKDFIQSLYTIINRLVEINEFKYFNLCLECLSKILAAKITYIKGNLKIKFISTNLKGLAQMFENIVNCRVNNVKIWMKVLQCSDKFLDFFDQCQKNDLAMLEEKEQQCFQIWVNHIFNIPILIMSSGQAINAQNQLFQLSAEVMGRMGNELVLQRISRDTTGISSYYQKFIQFFFRSFLLSNVKVMGETTFNSLKQFKKTTLFFLEKVAMTCSACYLLLFTQLNKLFMNCCNDLSHNELNISNILLFFTAMIESDNFFDRNIFQEILFEEKRIEDQKLVFKYPQQISALGDLLFSVFEFIKFYYTQLNLQSEPINTALTLFYESLLTKIVKYTFTFKMQELCLDNGPITIKNNLYKLIKARTNVKEQAFLLSGLIGISKLIKCQEITSIEFIFQCLYSIILKLKHKFSTENFKHTQIYKQMLELFKGIVNQNPSPDLVKCRVLLFKTISLLCYDEAFDDFRKNFRDILKIIEGSSEDEMDRVLYDLTGICDGIQSETIYNYFLMKFDATIDYPTLLQTLYNKFSTNQIYLKDILHLTYLLVKNKQKNEENKITTIIFNFLRSNLPFWSKMLQTFGNNEQKIEIFQELYLIFNTIMADGHINICLADDEYPNETRLFLKLMLAHLTYFLDHVQNYPQMIKKYCQVLENTLVYLKKFIYNHTDVQIPNLMTLLVNKLMQKFVLGFQNVINESINPTIFSMQLSFFEKYFSFLNESKSKLHTVLYHEYLAQFLAWNDLKQNFLANAFKLGIHFGARKDSHTILLITNVAHGATACFAFDVGKMIEMIGLTSQKDKLEYVRIIDNIQRNLEQWSNLQLKDWFTDELRCGKAVNPDEEDGY